MFAAGVYVEANATRMSVQPAPFTKLYTNHLPDRLNSNSSNHASSHTSSGNLLNIYIHM